MKKILFTLLLLLIGRSFPGGLAAQNNFVKGADVGFLTGQERRGVVFHDRKRRVIGTYLQTSNTPHTQPNQEESFYGNPVSP